MDRNVIQDCRSRQCIVALRKESVDRNQKMKSCRTLWSVALRKESVDRNQNERVKGCLRQVALRKESVDRNVPFDVIRPAIDVVALRKESVDRNSEINTRGSKKMKSLSARRAWIEISTQCRL